MAKRMSLKQGDTVSADVVDVKENGIYLRYEGIDGFVNVTEMSWKQEPINPHRYATKGERLDVRVYAVTADQFYASIKGLHPEDNPWRDPEAYAVGSRHSGTVGTVATFGAFVDLDRGAAGCLLGTPDEHGLKVGDRVVVEVVAVDPSRRRIELRKSAS
jgi:small subunit ribosomal protein S1